MNTKTTNRKRPSRHLRTLSSGKTIPINPHIKKEESYRSRKLHIVSFSGGKDSGAMLLRMIELKMPIDRILFCDTGHEFPALYRWVEKINEYTTKTIGVPVETLQPYNNKTWDDWFYGEISRGEHKGRLRGFPVLTAHCYWSREAKFRVLEPICKGNIRYIGFGADEVKRIEAGRKKPGYEFPLADWGWTEEDCRQYLIEKGWAEPYHIDFHRTGCTFCPYQKKDSLHTLARKYPVEWKKLMRYAKDAHSDPRFLSKIFRPGIGYPELLEIQREEQGR